MKKLLCFMLLCATTCISLSSCSKDDDGISKNKIIGTWDAKQVKIDSDWITIPSDNRFSMSITFYEDGTYYGKSEIFGSGSGAYKIIGNSIKTYINGGYLYTYRINNITDTTAEVTMIDEHSDNDSSLDIRLQKR